MSSSRKRQKSDDSTPTAPENSSKRRKHGTRRTRVYFSPGGVASQTGGTNVINNTFDGALSTHVNFAPGGVAGQTGGTTVIHNGRDGATETVVLDADSSGDDDSSSDSSEDTTVHLDCGDINVRNDEEGIRVDSSGITINRGGNTCSRRSRRSRSTTSSGYTSIGVSAPSSAFSRVRVGKMNFTCGSIVAQTDKGTLRAESLLRASRDGRKLNKEQYEVFKEVKDSFGSIVVGEHKIDYKKVLDLGHS